MKFKMLVGHARKADSWWEDYDYAEAVDEASAIVVATRLIHQFNATLRPNEEPRQLMGLIFGVGSGIQKHQWEKKSLVTESERGQLFDRMECSVCHVTGRRYGLDPVVIRDKQFRGKAFDNCVSAQKKMKAGAK